MLDRARLLELAAAEEVAFGDVRLERVYVAMCRKAGVLVEPPVPLAEAQRRLNAALDAVTEADIRRAMPARSAPGSIAESMLQLKRQRLAELSQNRRQYVEPEEDSEPQQE